MRLAGHFKREGAEAWEMDVEKVRNGLRLKLWTLSARTKKVIAARRSSGSAAESPPKTAPNYHTHVQLTIIYDYVRFW
jgi:hypothetical protein